jgi:hypothetical protein
MTDRDWRLENINIGNIMSKKHPLYKVILLSFLVLILGALLTFISACDPPTPLEVENKTDQVLSIYVNDYYQFDVEPGKVVKQDTVPMIYEYYMIEAKNGIGEIIYSTKISFQKLSGNHWKIVIPLSELPAHFTTYTDEDGLFSISYPQEWEIYTSRIEDAAKVVISEGDLDALMENSLQKASIIFLAGLPTEREHDPNMNIIVEPIPIALRTQSKLVEANLVNIKKVCQDYYMHSRTDTVIDGKEATITEWEGAMTSGVKTYSVQLTILNGKTGWYVGCNTCDLNVYEEYGDDFRHIVSSLRIYK